VQPINGKILTGNRDFVGVFALTSDGRSLAYTTAEPDPDLEKALSKKRDFRVFDEKPKNATSFPLNRCRPSSVFQSRG